MKNLWELIKQYKWWVIGAVIGIFLLSSLGTCSGSSGGDGITTCKNCGKSEVVSFGFCGRCADGFLDWQKDQD